jgi:hypothetical protein
LVHARGDFTRDASGARVGGFAFKKGLISRAVDMPRSSCDHRALSPSGPPDGVRQCSQERSTSRLSLPAISPLESVRSWWCHWFCLLLAAVGGVQPHGSCHPSTIIRLRGFSSRIPAAVPRRWSSRRMSTSLVVGRSKPGCGLPPALNFKDVHHPCWGGGCAELGPASAWVAARFFPQCSGEKGVRRLWRCQLPRVWLPGPTCPTLGRRRRFLSLGRSVAARPPHGRRSRHVRVGHIHGFSRATGRTGRLYKTSYAAGAATAFLDGLVLTPIVRTGAKTSSCALVQPLPVGAEVVTASGGLMWSPPLVRLLKGK